MSTTRYPCSPKKELAGLPYFPRLCEKIRLFAAGELHPELHANLGRAMDLWTCQFLGVSYEFIKEQVLAGKSDEDVLIAAQQEGVTRPDYETDWFRSYLLNRGFRDDLSDRLEVRLKESGFEERTDIYSFADYIDADEEGK